MTTYENERYERSDSMCAAHPGQTKSDVSHTDLQSECSLYWYLYIYG